MNFDYHKGYWKSQVDLLHILENMDDSSLRSKKQYKNFITSLLKLVLTNTMRAWYNNRAAGPRPRAAPQL